jgi:hypothetical protein
MAMLCWTVSSICCGFLTVLISPVFVRLVLESDGKGLMLDLAFKLGILI